MGRRAKRSIYVLHPGYVTSRNDGDRHFIDASRLARLYGIPLRDCLRMSQVPARDLGKVVHLYPRFDGNYTLPVKHGQPS